MPGQRAAGQKLIVYPASEDFIDAVAGALRDLGVANRSQFTREAIVEKLERHGINVPKQLAAAPERFDAKGQGVSYRDAMRKAARRRKEQQS